MEAVKEASKKDEDGYEIKKIFQEWDGNSDGSISRSELVRVLKEISDLTEKDIDRLMKEVDKNCNGKIEVDEFVDWIMRPPSKSQVRAMIDYKNVLRPLFDLYDRNHNGSISFREFEEIHGLLQTTLTPILQEEQGDMKSSLSNDPFDLMLDAKAAFKEADTTNDGEVSFRDFVEWMSKHLDSLPNYADRESDLVDMVSKLAKMMQQAFRLKGITSVNPFQGRKYAPSADEQETAKVLDRLLKNLGNTTKKLTEVLGKDRTLMKPDRNTWSDPPPGMSVERLKGTHMRLFPVKKIREVEELGFDVLCIPAPQVENDDKKDPADREWYAKVVRRVKWHAGSHVPGHPIKEGEKQPTAVEKPVYYTYDPESFRWYPRESSDEFDEGARLLPPELLVFCLLKSEANLGVSMGWATIETALKNAIKMGLIHQSHLADFRDSLEDSIQELYAAEGHLGCTTPSLSTSGREVYVQEFLEEQLDLNPCIVMAKLSELGAVDVSPVWKEFMDEEAFAQEDKEDEEEEDENEDEAKSEAKLDDEEEEEKKEEAKEEAKKEETQKKEEKKKEEKKKEESKE